MKSSSISRVPANKSQGLVILAQSGKRDRSHTLEHQLALPTSGDAKTMKTKTWTVIANTGKQADLESGLEKKTVQKPAPEILLIGWRLKAALMTPLCNHY